MLLSTYLSGSIRGNTGWLEWEDGSVSKLAITRVKVQEEIAQVLLRLCINHSVLQGEGLAVEILSIIISDALIPCGNSPQGCSCGISVSISPCFAIHSRHIQSC